MQKLVFRLAIGPIQAALLTIVLAPADASAYGWMIRHDYSGCATCHADPSGSGLLTEYGRAQSALLLSTQYGKAGEATEPGRFKDFAFGVPTPSWLTLGAWARYGYLANSAGGKFVDKRFLQMRGDLAAQFKWKAFRANGSLGYAAADSASQSQRAWVTSYQGKANLVSREYWVGADLSEQKTMLLRGGRMNVPFGLRNVEHTSWVRSETRTDINQSQQVGASFAYGDDRWRSEAMVIAGNFQIRPDDYRERGYSGYAEYQIRPRYTLGASSLVTHAQLDLVQRQPLWRQAHGLFTRIAPWRPLVLTAEANALISSPSGTNTRLGYVAFAQGDYEPIQGLHVVLTVESTMQPVAGVSPRFGEWVGLWWFPLPHFDVRFDVIHRHGDGSETMTYLVQGQIYL